MSEFRVLIVGVGSIGERHLRTFQKSGRATVAICEPNQALRERIIQQYAPSAAYDSLDAAIADDFDAAVIATPAPLHIAMARRLAAAGKHLLIEKPLSTSLDDVDALVAEVAESGLAVAIGYTWRSHPVVQSLKQALDSGRFGKVLQLTFVGGQHFPTHRPAYRDTYFCRHESGGGTIMDCLTHMLNVGEWLCGPITELAADATLAKLEGVEVEDTVSVICRHGSTLGTYAQNQHQSPNALRFTFVCEHGTIEADILKGEWRCMFAPESEWEYEHCPVEERDELYITQANAFMDAINGSPPLCSLADGVASLRSTLATLESSSSHQWLTVNK